MVLNSGGACRGLMEFDRARDVPLATEIVHEVLLALSVAADVVVVDLPRPDHEIFAALTPSVDAMVLLAGSGIRDLAGASAFSEHLIRACPDVWLSLRTNGKGGHFADTVAGALDLPLLAVVREVPSLAADLLHGIPPGSSAGGALAAAADTVLARSSSVRDRTPRERHRRCGPTIRAGRAATMGWLRRFSILGGGGQSRTSAAVPRIPERRCGP